MAEKGRRFCPWRELDCRWQEWPQFSKKEKEANPDYCLYDQVVLDMKRVNKGSHWNIMGSNINNKRNI
eukprot:6931718-Prorocentrum_lima.AAC.1